MKKGIALLMVLSWVASMGLGSATELMQKTNKPKPTKHSKKKNKPAASDAMQNSQTAGPGMGIPVEGKDVQKEKANKPTAKEDFSLKSPGNQMKNQVEMSSTDQMADKGSHGSKPTKDVKKPNNQNGPGAASSNLNGLQSAGSAMEEKNIQKQTKNDKTNKGAKPTTKENFSLKSQGRSPESQVGMSSTDQMTDKGSHGSKSTKDLKKPKKQNGLGAASSNLASLQSTGSAMEGKNIQKPTKNGKSKNNSKLTQKDKKIINGQENTQSGMMGHEVVKNGGSDQP